MMKSLSRFGQVLITLLPLVSGQLRSSDVMIPLDHGQRELFTCGDDPMPVFGSSIKAENVVSFAALADGPYAFSERYCINHQLRELDLKSPDGPSFLIHLGDIKPGGGRCSESVFQELANIFAHPDNAVGYDPDHVFWVVGDNEWNDCGDPDEAWDLWTKYFGPGNQMGYGTLSSTNVNVKRQTGVERLPGVNRGENFAFLKDNVLFVGLHMVGGGTVGDESIRVAQNFEWVRKNLRENKNEIVSAVIFGHARMGGERRNDFGLPLMDLLRKEFKDLPVLYLHGDGHDYCVNYVDDKNPNLVEVELEAVEEAPPVVISVLRNPNDDTHIFDIDRRGGPYPGPCPRVEQNTWSQVDGPRAVTPNPTPSPPSTVPPTQRPAPSSTPSPTPEQSEGPLGVHFSVVSTNLGISVETTDLDDSVKSVELYMNDAMVRREGEAPYEWGLANRNEHDPELLNLSSGVHELRAKVIDVNGQTASSTMRVTIDLCPDDPNKLDPGNCGCGTPEDSQCNIVDLCPDDPNKIVPGECGCGNPEQNPCVDLCPGDPLKVGPGNCGCGNLERNPCSGVDDQVRASDTIFVRPESNGPIIAPITAYTWRDAGDWPDSQYERPIYKTLNRDDDAYWNYVVDELLLSRVDVIMFHGRGCFDETSGLRGQGDLCPRNLEKFVSAVDRAGARDALKVGMWDDTAVYNKAMQRLENLPPGTTLDLSNRSNWRYFWDLNIKMWFDTLPEDMWYLMDGKPVIAFWNLRDRYFSNQQGNASKLLDYIVTKFQERYGKEPALILQDDWFEQDTTIDSSLATGRHDWFKPVHDVASSLYSYTNYNGDKWGCVAPSFRTGGDYNPGCGTACREVSRRDGNSLSMALDAGADAKFILLEGWNNMAESAGFYRSLDWAYPTQYINIVRQYADPFPETLRFQAEGADSFFDTTTANLGGHYADRELDVGKLDDNSGWYVGWTSKGEWLEYKNVQLGCGTYRFTVRVATKNLGKKLRLDLGGLSTVDLPFTGGLSHYQHVHLGELELQEGNYDVRLVMESTGGLNVDWLFLKRSSTNCTGF